MASLSDAIVLFLVDALIISYLTSFVCFFQAEDGIRDLVRSRGLGDVYKRQKEQVGDLIREFPKLYK